MAPGSSAAERARLSVVEPGGVTVERGVVVDTWGGPPPPGALRLREGMLVPGLVDLQLNGAYGIDCADASSRDLANLAARLPRAGVTSFLPTAVTAPMGALTDWLGTVAAAQRAWRPPAARILGAHVEGPFLVPARAGAHDPGLFCDPTRDRIRALYEAGGGALAVLTLAPERAGALQAIEALAARGVVVALGHSDATAAQATAATAAGARLVTHLFNASSPLGHRAPGLPGVALTDPRLSVGLIADFVHVDPLVVRLVLAAAGERVVLTSDAMAAAGMGPGAYRLAGRTVYLEAGDAPRGADGGLAGSATLAGQAFANLLALGVEPALACNAAAQRPAALLRRQDLGRIRPGAAADLVWLDGTGAVRATWVAGQLAWGDPGA